MDKNLKMFLLSFLVALPFWWTMNILEKNLNDFFFWQIVGDNPRTVTAQIGPILEEEIIAPIAEPKQSLEIKAKSAISIEFDAQGRENILFKLNEKEKLPIASLTKLMTALIALNIYPDEQKLRISKEAVRQPGERGELKPDEIVSVTNLLNMSLIESSNDAAYALSEGKISNDGSYLEQEEFIELMNLKTKELGSQDSQFFNPTGLDSEDDFDNYSTAEDLAKIVYHISREYPTILEISNKMEYQLLDDLGDIHHLTKNTNKLIGEIPDTIGGKTGYTEKAGGCIILVLNKNDSCIVNVILGAESQETRFEEMKKLING